MEWVTCQGPVRKVGDGAWKGVVWESECVCDVDGARKLREIALAVSLLLVMVAFSFLL